MLYIIIGIIVICIIWSILSSIFEFLSEIKPLIIGVIVFLVCLWTGILGVVIAILGIACLLYVAKQIWEKHDKNKREIAEINKNTQQAQEMQSNEFALIEELNERCRWLGFMNERMWAQQLPNYINRPYQSNFDSITTNFARQMEQQNILQSDDWFQPFFQYILDHPEGTTPTKLLNEVRCPQLQVTHVTPNIDLLTAQLKKGTKDVSRDVRALFTERSFSGLEDNFYVPTPYALKTYRPSSNDSGTMNRTEYDINDL